MERERSFDRMMWISMLVLFLEAVTVAILTELHGQTQESPNADINALGLFLMPFLAIPGALLGAVLSLLLVIPTVRLSEALGRRFTGREIWWWVPAVAAAGLAPLGLLAALTGFLGPIDAVSAWCAATVLLSVAALFTRIARKGLFGSVLLWGTLAVLGTGVLGVMALDLGIVDAYAPPVVSRASLVGEWTDGNGGTLTLSDDGVAVVSAVGDPAYDAEDTEGMERCTGRGTWSYDRGEGPRGQAIAVTVPECDWTPWEVGGSDGRVTVYQYVGDPDAWVLYTLTKLPR
ncbi:hypothetical protein [Streptomyces sp. NBC_00102]|uniref:hypothetical protein n=1 Tax=Streptomyces sp. NBC_00102 TaxID=2975652 RepID=UPI00224EEC85|nr:hypothetical protein [Streptomyces sp. NBC_00102]MCX5399724.1 hypothetical protein [Streptomyces sp. NBC_00102]